MNLTCKLAGIEEKLLLVLFSGGFCRNSRKTALNIHSLMTYPIHFTAALASSVIESSMEFFIIVIHVT